jgi:hypothetical protein
VWTIGIDVLAIVVLAYGIYFRRHRRRELVVAYLALNVGVLGVTLVLASASVAAGLGLGLFGVLSIIRLRSSSLSQEEVAYYFIALALGLIAGLQPGDAWVSPVMSALLLLVMYVGDHPRIHSSYRQQTVTLDAAYADETELRAELEDLLGAKVARMQVAELDLVRDVTVVDVRYWLQREKAARPVVRPGTNARSVQVMAAGNGSGRPVAAQAPS